MYRPGVVSSYNHPRSLIDEDELNQNINVTIDKNQSDNGSLLKLRTKRNQINTIKYKYYKCRQQEVLNHIKEILLNNLPTYYDIHNFICKNPNASKFIIYQFKHNIQKKTNIENYYWNNIINKNCFTYDNYQIQFCHEVGHDDYVYNPNINLTKGKINYTYIYNYLKTINIKGLGKPTCSDSWWSYNCKIYYKI